MNLANRSALECCEKIVTRSPFAMTSETIQELIKRYGGKHYKVSNLERRMRESDNIRSVKVPGKNYVKYSYLEAL